jgi:hypothetical protein
MIMRRRVVMVGKRRQCLFALRELQNQAAAGPDEVAQSVGSPPYLLEEVKVA